MSDQNSMYPDAETQTLPSASEPIPAPPRRVEPEASPHPAPASEKPSRKGGLLPEEAQTLSEIIASLGGATAGRLKLCVQRNVRGVGWKSLRAVQIEEWMIEGGLDVTEVVGEAYGDGFYRWQLRYAGKFLRKGDCHLEGYDEVRDDAVPPPDNEDVQPVDVMQALVQLRKEIKDEMKAAAPQALSGQGDQLKAVMDPLMRFLESKFPGQPQRPQGPDPTVTALIGMMAQQTNTFMQVMAQGMGQHPGGAQATLKDNVGALKEIIEVARTLTAPQGFSYDMGLDETAAELPATEQPPAPQGNPILDQLGKTATGALNRLLSNLIQVGEEKLAGQVSQMAASQGGASVPPAPSAPATNLTPENVQEYEGLFNVLEACVAQNIPVEKIVRDLAENLPAETLRQLASDGMSAAKLTELSALLGKPGITEKLQQPAFQSYLTRLIEIFRVHLAKLKQSDRSKTA